MRAADRPDGPADARGSTARRVVSRLRLPLAAAAAAAAALLLILRLGLPLIETQRSEVEQWVSGLLQRPVTIESLRARWEGWSIRLDVLGVSLYPSDHAGAPAAPAITFDRVRIGVRPLDSLMAGAVQPHSLVIGGASVTVKRLESGRLVVAGMQPSGGAPLDKMSDDLAGWLFKDGTLALDELSIKWLDARREADPILLSNARLDLVNEGLNHTLSGNFEIPGLSEERIRFALEARGNLLSSDWSGRMAVSAEKVRAADLSRMFRPVERWVFGGRADIHAWTDWNQAKLTHAQVRIRADGLTLGEAAGGLRIHGGTAEIEAGRLGQGWASEIVLRDLHTSEGRWPQTRGTVQYLGAGAPPPGPRLLGRFEAARLADLRHLFSAPLKALGIGGGRLAAYRPSAELRNVHFALGLDGDTDPSFQLTAEFQELSAAMGAGLPSLSGYSGRMEIDDNTGVVSLHRGILDVAVGDVFEPRFLADTQGGRVAWRVDPESVRADVHDVSVSAPAIESELSGFVQWDGDDAGPLISLVAAFSSNDVAAARRYIPEPLLKEKLVKWLHHALKGGQISNGRVLLHGRAGAFPFDDGKGVLEALFEVEDGELDYAPGWPGLSALTGEIRFQGRRMDATVRQGRILGARIQSGAVSVASIGRGVPVLEVRGEAVGKASEGLSYLTKSPLGTRFKPQLRDIRVGGDIRLSLSLALPLDRSGLTLDGRVALNGNSIDFARLDTGLRKVDGTLHFDRRGARAEGMSATYLGRPVTMDISTSDERPHDTRVSISGRADSRFLGRHLVNAGLGDLSGAAASPWLDRITGETAWQATVYVPASADGPAGNRRMVLESSLEGVGIALPSPLGKQAETRRMLRVEFERTGARRRLARGSLGGDIRALIELDQDGDELRPRRGTVRFGGEEAALPGSEGLRVTGTLVHLDAGAWMEILNSGPAQLDRRPAPYPLRDLALDVAQLRLLGSSFKDTRITASRGAKGAWSARLDGAGLKGSVQLPSGSQSSPIIASFDEVEFTSGSAGGSAGIVDPSKIPALRFEIKRFIYDGRELGRVELSASPSKDGLEFGSIFINSDSFEVTANGFWDRKGGTHQSRFSISLRSERFGEFLESLGFGGTNVHGGITDIFVDARWNSPPVDFDLKTLNGELHFRSLDGRLLGIKRGATGRIFGLLSFTTLPRRLTFDFTDLFEKGVSYERIEGSFNLENGQAYTNNLMMETDTAVVEIAGRTGLATEDYDQLMTVTPKLTSSIPFAPIWLAEKVFQRDDFDRAFAAQYNITGPWSDPKVEPVEAKTPPSERG